MQFEKLLVLNSNIPRHAYNDIFEMNFTVNLQKLIKFFKIHGPRTKIDRHLSLRCSSLSDREQITVVDGMVHDPSWARICQPRFPSPMSRRSIQEKSVWGLQNCLCLRLHPVWVTMEPFDPTLHLSWKVRYRTILWFSAKWANFRGLVLFCIDAKFCKIIFVGKLLTRSTRCACFCTAQAPIFQKIFVNALIF